MGTLEDLYDALASCSLPYRWNRRVGVRRSRHWTLRFRFVTN